MTKPVKGKSFATLFKKYRLRSEIETLSEFGDLLAEEGLIYETSLFTRWQNGERIPKDRKVLMAILSVFIKNGGILNFSEANKLLEGANQGYLTKLEKDSFDTFFSQQLLTRKTDSFGNLMRSFRLKRNLSQLEMSLALGWKDISFINSIEEGLEEKPSRGEVDRLCNVLQLSEKEKNRLLYIGNYLPTLSEIETVRNEVSPIIDSWPYPAVILDFTWRIIDENSKNQQLFNESENFIQRTAVDFTNVIEVLFDPKFFMNKLNGEILSKHREWQYQILLHFKEAHKNRTREKWYTELIQKMLNNDVFKEKWEKVQQSKETLIFSNHGTKLLPHPTNKQLLKFHFFVIPLFNDPRFEIEFYNPADYTTFEFYNHSG